MQSVMSRSEGVTNQAVQPRNSIESIMNQRNGPGIVLLSSGMQLLYMNRQAKSIWRHVEQDPGLSLVVPTNGNKSATTGTLPPVLLDLCAELVKAMQVTDEPKDWEECEVRRLGGSPQRPVLIRGVGLPDAWSPSGSRILVTLEEVGRRQSTSMEQAKERFQLTEREQTVVERLSKGWTNKEIASDLGIAQQTVKEHIKRIMLKTNSSTRTGVVSKIFLA